jgi:hypothetical protein
MQTIIKLILSILLIIGILDMSYSYDEAVRFIALVAFGLLAYLENKNGNKGSSSSLYIFGAPISTIF